MNKYKLTEEKIEAGSATLCRTQALRGFGDVKAGDLGGFIEKEENLSHDGDCWVYGNTRVCGSANISDSIRLSGRAIIDSNEDFCYFW